MPSTTTDFFMVAIRKHIEDIIEQEADRASKEAYKRVKQDAGNIAVRILENFSIYSEGRKWIIEVKKDD